MNIKRREELQNYLLSSEFTTIQDADYTWNELGQLYGLSGEAARAVWRRVKKEKRQFNKNTQDKLKQFCQEQGINYNDVTRAKYITHNNNSTFNLTLDKQALTKGFIQEIEEVLQSVLVKDYSIKPIKIEGKQYDQSMHINISDIHIGMDIPESFYGFKWNKEQLMFRLKHLCYIVDTRIKSETELLVLNVLGDVTDGQDGMTTRAIKGTSKHKLPQNMTNKEMYETGVEFFMSLITYLKSYNLPVTINYVSNSNHGGIIDYTIGSTLKKLISLKFNDVQFNLHDSFINHVALGNIDLLTTHGYDEEFVSKFNKMPMHFDYKWLLRIKNYLNKYKCKGDLKLLLRGDLHRHNTCSYNEFEDIMVPAFSPPSTYIQKNFDSDLSKSGFSLLHTNESSYQLEPYYFE